MDADADGTLSLPEFRALFDEAALVRVFREIDSDGSGTIDVAELTQALSRACGLHLPERQVARMLRKVDTGRDGSVSLDEFRAFFKDVPLADLRAIAARWASVGG